MNPKNAEFLKENDFQAVKSGVKTGYLTLDGHISQIPGLSPTIRTVPEERARGRRAVVLESDSAYVKLAKQGGHKGLLSHEEAVTSTPNSYKPPDWFSSESGDISQQSKDEKSPGAFQTLEPPFGSDNMSAWERENEGSPEKEKNDEGLYICTEELKAQTEHQEPGKYKRIVFDKKPAPVDMSKLLSFGYAEANSPVQ
ncbi:hypothetical protein OJAV_G00205440 [Oryzias javanicus]|uniref:Uncharacterized protein n=1 Tax=Oryzias javanicus TaxID=123683 RepID=A0A3S2M188_ORYJA|nr:hypothetical protein OJAV_G00205440 [Oryzias javanicus]